MEKELPKDAAVINMDSSLAKEAAKLEQLKIWGMVVFGRDFIIEVDPIENKSVYKTSLTKFSRKLLIALDNSVRELMGPVWKNEVRSGKFILIKDGKFLNNVGKTTRHSSDNNKPKRKRAKSLRSDRRK